LIPLYLAPTRPFNRLDITGEPTAVATTAATTVATTLAIMVAVVLVAGQLSHLTLHRPGHLPRFAFSLRLEFPFSFGALINWLR
jgi:hypothetical protein